MRWPLSASPRILSEDLAPVPEPLAVALRPAAGGEAPPRAVVALAARALLDGATGAPAPWPAWLAPHQVPAAERLAAILARHGGALLADAVGLGKSYVALAIALARGELFALIVPAVLVPQWRALLEHFGAEAPIVTHEALSVATDRLDRPDRRLFIVDEAHRFRNPDTNRHRALARLVVGARVLLVTATPVHNQLADLFHLFRLFLRDHALAALGVPSLRRAARGELDPGLLAAAAARLVVGRSRARVCAGYGEAHSDPPPSPSPVILAFPQRTGAETLRVGTAPGVVLEALVAGVRRLRLGGPAAPLLRLLLLRRLASSLPAFRASLLRYEAYADLAARAAAEGRGLSPREFQRCFPRAVEPELQLVLFPVLLDAGAADPPVADRRELARLKALAAEARDPKADALERLLDARPGKTIVFTDAEPTVRHLLHRLRRRRAAGREAIPAFAPVAQGAPPPPPALATDLLVVTDLVSEGLNLQDAKRVVHYDLPWSPARLAQRVGRIDRLGSPHAAIDTVTFLPQEPLAAALELEARHAAKIRAQVAAGAAQVETPRGERPGEPILDWCDRLDQLGRGADAKAEAGSAAAARGDHAATVLVVRIGELVEAIVVDGDTARPDPADATRLLADARTAPPAPLDQAALRRALVTAAPLVRDRLAAVQGARWRAPDRDRFARRLIPWVLSAARRAARRGDAAQLGALDALVSRLALGMTAGEELLLEDLLARREPLAVRDLLAWHDRLPPVQADDTAIEVELVAALAVG